ncbi:16S rRNA (guanine(527)-N(7))-methyltransferase RsmG [Ornithinimicrobium cryptoxanthini]|uniref:Ribosomal RNA small subunit methyltransferase G n=1 Tax=Ornithinimicrobium cryptoxanthini TaxID=2934161 RepID=A0ABY4YI42_9MICO|nr:16S rRNA (guanine(527)-N(7))-methyltransferase RsmG [Ornithinimicrobium cryptoxanthini]USQ76349.1 16S rRNA (guanine(527)-N(7))-methyltransferase RsmG [Ornithinimicrobium cryptoxanthini]
MKHDQTEQPGLPERPPPVASEVFGNQLPVVEHFAHLLADTGVSHGLIGPRETPRLWERHLLNCGVVESVLPHRTRLIDVGSGAGLPGLVLAIARPDLDVVLVEPMLRRTTWLESTVQELSLSNVQVLRGRAQDFWGKLRAPVVTARAVARIGELSRWCLPLLDAEGRLIALKGATAGRELAEDEAELRRAGAVSGHLTLLGEELMSEPTRLIEIQIGDRPVRPTEAAVKAAAASRKPGSSRRAAPTSGRSGSTARSAGSSTRRGSRDSARDGRG